VVGLPRLSDRPSARAASVGARVAAPSFVLLWSSAFIAGSVGLRSAPPLLLTLIRLAAAGAILALVSWVTRAPWPRGRQLGHVIVAGLLLQAAQFGGFYWAMSLGLPAALTALIQGLTPVLTATAAWLLLRERTSRGQRIGFAAGVAGVVLAVAGRLDVHAGVAVALVPAAVGLAGAGLGMLYQQRYRAAMDLRTGTATQLLASVPVLGALTLAVEHPAVSHPLPFAGALAWLVLVNSIGAFTLMYTMLRHRPASRLVVSGAGVTLATRRPTPAGTARERPGQRPVPEPARARAAVPAAAPAVARDRAACRD